MSDEAKCLCVMGTNGPVGDGWYVIGAMRLGTPLYARVDCPTCRGTGKPALARANGVDEGAGDTVAALAVALAKASEGTGFSRDPGAWRRSIQNRIAGDNTDYPPDMPLRDRYIALIARERAKRATPEADTVDSLAREMAASTGDSPDHWRAYLVSVCGGIAFSKESRHIWNREPTPGLGDRIAAFTDRERAKRAAADRALAAAHMALTFPPVVFVTKGEHDKALARIAELEQQVAAPRCPTDADWSTLDAALVACAKLDERTIPAVTAARATIAAVRDAVTEIGVTAAVGAFGRLAGSASPASTLAATIPAEPVGMASDCDEGGEW
jgi:hypothetical protein